MQQHEGVILSSNPDRSDRCQVTRSFSHVLSLIAVSLLLLATLACSFIRSNSGSAGNVVLVGTRLSTLTPTRLPTLTPTPGLTLTAAAAGAWPVEAALTTPVPDTGAASDLAPTPGGDTPASSPAVSDAARTEDAAPDSPDVSDASVAANSPMPEETAATQPAAANSTLDTPVSLPAPTASQTPTPTIPPTATPTAAPTATDTPTETPSPTPLPEGWVFASVRLDQSQGDLQMYGDVINNTGQPQDLALISGNFFDAQGQPISASTFDYWPIETIPVGARVPFELTIFGVQNVGDFDLVVEATPSDEADIPTGDFEFLEVNASADSGDYCVSGKLRNLSGELRFYLSTVLILYDEADNLINFGDDYMTSPPNLVGDQTLDFNVCIDPLGQNVARYDIRAWGL